MPALLGWDQAIDPSRVQGGGALTEADPSSHPFPPVRSRVRSSLPPYLCRALLGAGVRRGERGLAVVLHEVVHHLLGDVVLRGGGCVVSTRLTVLATMQ